MTLWIPRISVIARISGISRISGEKLEFCHSRDIETEGAYYDKYKDFKFILAASVLLN